MIWFWADTHFNHPGIMHYCARPYENVWEMNQDLVDRWNSVVGGRDEIYLLGDFGFYHSSLPPLEGIFSLLKGKKHLIIGNHDEKNKRVLKLPWTTQETLQMLRQDGARVGLCHYPFETWASAHKGSLHLHGHSHGSLKRKIPHRWDVGVDAEPYPISLEEVLRRGREEVFEPTDNHGDV